MVWNVIANVHLLVKPGIAGYTALPFARNWRMAYFRRTRKRYALEKKFGETLSDIRQPYALSAYIPLLAVFCIVHIPSATSSSRVVSSCDAFAKSRWFCFSSGSDAIVRLTSLYVILLACFSMWCGVGALQVSRGRRWRRKQVRHKHDTNNMDHFRREPATQITSVGQEEVIEKYANAQWLRWC